MLSKSTLYAPLSAYDATCIHGPKQKQKKKKNDVPHGGDSFKNEKVRKTISAAPTSASLCRPPSQGETQEVYSFLQELSHEFYSPTSLVTNSKYFQKSMLGQANHNKGQGKTKRVLYHGSQQAVSKNSFESKLVQRVLTLVGGGITTTLTPSTVDILKASSAAAATAATGHPGKRNRSGDIKHIPSTSSFFPGYKSHRKRKRIQQQQEGPWNLKHTIHKNTHLPHVLHQLHEMWKEYFYTLIHQHSIALMNPNQNTTDMDGVTCRINRLSNLLSYSSVELVGAHVRIIQCKACLNRIHQQGFVVLDTLNTWQLAIPSHSMNTTSTSKNERRNNNKKNSNKEDINGNNIPREKAIKNEKEEEVEGVGKKDGNVSSTSISKVSLPISSSSSSSSSSTITTSTSWKVIVIPKRHTILEVEIPIPLAIVPFFQQQVYQGNPVMKKVYNTSKSCDSRPTSYTSNNMKHTTIFQPQMNMDASSENLRIKIQIYGPT